MKQTAIAVSVALVAAGPCGPVAAQSMEPSVPSGWVELPGTGATTARAYALIENPTMDAVRIVKASADVAASVELRQTETDAALEFLFVPAYGSLDMHAGGVHLLLKNLRRRLAVGDKVTLTLVTGLGLEFRVEAKVQRSPPARADRRVRRLRSLTAWGADVRDCAGRESRREM